MPPKPEAEPGLTWTVGAEAGGGRAGQNGAAHVFTCGTDCCGAQLTLKGCTADTCVVRFPLRCGKQQNDEVFEVSNSPWALSIATLSRIKLETPFAHAYAMN